MTGRPGPRYGGSVMVVKCGGAAGIDDAHVCADVAAYHAAGGVVVMVHGGSAAVASLAARLGVAASTFESPSGVTARHTDRATLEVVTLALVGSVQIALLIELGKRGVPAVGLCGADAGMLRARRKRARALVGGRQVVLGSDHSGQMVSVDTSLLRHLLASGIVPVVSPPAVAEDGELVNVNADRVAAWVAGAVGADQLVLLTAAPGVLADPDDERSVRGDCTLAAGAALPPYARGGMAVKLIAAREALSMGVGTVVISDGRTDHPVRRALGGAGTRILPHAGERSASNP